MVAQQRQLRRRLQLLVQHLEKQDSRNGRDSVIRTWRPREVTDCWMLRMWSKEARDCARLL